MDGGQLGENWPCMVVAYNTWWLQQFQVFSASLYLRNFHCGVLNVSWWGEVSGALYLPLLCNGMLFPFISKWLLMFYGETSGFYKFLLNGMSHRLTAGSRAWH